MKKILIGLCVSLLISVCGFAATLSVGWTNGDNPAATSNLVVYGVSPGVYTNTVAIPFAQTSLTLTNLAAGVRYYVNVRCTDGVDFSDYTTEVSAKTKMNSPKNLNVTAP